MSYMYIKALAAQQGCKTLTVACLNIKQLTKREKYRKVNKVERFF